MPQMPEISSDLQMPSMPEISTSSENSFYIPDLQTQYQKNSKSNSLQNVDSNDVNSQVLNSQTTISNSDSSLLLNFGKDILSAGDISSLYETGMFSGIASLSENSFNNSQNENSTNLLLQKILLTLDELKSERKNSNSAEQKSDSEEISDSENFRVRKPQILRFKVNGYDINSSLEKVFFSECENDGTFLLSADRIYFADGKRRNETFYVLFKAEKGNGNSVTYKVEPSIVQDYENKNSYVRHFAEKKGMKATKTGNLVTLVDTDGKWKVDMLLNIDNFTEKN